MIASKSGLDNAQNIFKRIIIKMIKELKEDANKFQHEDCDKTKNWIKQWKQFNI